MADSPDTPPGAPKPDGAAAGGEPQQPPRLTIQAQYVKDLSFENPRAPKSLEPGQGRPEIQVKVDVRAQQLTEERHEVALVLNVEARAGGEVTFAVELTYGGVFGLINIPDDGRTPVLLIECPRLLFPFARRIVADATRDGGFPPLMIDPIDFLALFRQRQQAAASQRSGGEAVGNPTG